MAEIKVTEYQKQILNHGLDSLEEGNDSETISLLRLNITNGIISTQFFTPKTEETLVDCIEKNTWLKTLAGSRLIAGRQSMERLHRKMEGLLGRELEKPDWNIEVDR